MQRNVISYHSKLVGVTFEERQKVVSKLSTNTPLRFRRELDNPYDSNAVAVDALVNKKEGTWAHIGFIARDKNSNLARLLSEGKYAEIRISEITGGGDKNYGVNVYIEHEKEPQQVRASNAVLMKDMFGNDIFYDDDLHQYTNSLGEVYLSGSKYAESFERPFDAPMISSMMASKYDLGSGTAETIQEMWSLKSLASTSFGTALHAALELYGRFKGLSESMGKTTHLHDNPVLKKAVERFYSQYPNTLTVEYECLVVDHSKKRAGRVDRLEYDPDGVYIADFKTNVDIKKSLKKYWLQLSFYAAIMKANGVKVKGLRIYHYDGNDWSTIESEVIDIDRVKPELRPEVLTHPNIPKPLHEVNPRNIMGKEKWDSVREEAYASTDYHCIACGVHKSKAKGPKWLEAHEFYSIDYTLGRVEVDRIIPLCHYCHNFIHSGRLSMVMGKEKTEKEVKSILEHGFKVLDSAGLPAFYFTLEFAALVGAKTYGVKAAPRPVNEVEWEDWRLVWEGKEYPPKYKTEEEWRVRYATT